MWTADEKTILLCMCLYMYKIFLIEFNAYHVLLIIISISKSNFLATFPRKKDLWIRIRKDEQRPATNWQYIMLDFLIRIKYFRTRRYQESHFIRNHPMTFYLSILDFLALQLYFLRSSILHVLLVFERDLSLTILLLLILIRTGHSDGEKKFNKFFWIWKNPGERMSIPHII